MHSKKMCNPVIRYNLKSSSTCIKKALAAVGLTKGFFIWFVWHAALGQSGVKCKESQIIQDQSPID